MSNHKLTREMLEDLARNRPAAPAEWIRVQLDTGGIAAGAESVFEALVQARDAASRSRARRAAGAGRRARRSGAAPAPA